jgi:hypothetical protein
MTAREILSTASATSRARLNGNPRATSSAVAVSGAGRATISDLVATSLALSASLIAREIGALREALSAAAAPSVVVRGMLTARETTSAAAAASLGRVKLVPRAVSLVVAASLTTKCREIV